MDAPSNPVSPATSTTRPHGQRGAFSQAEHDENVGFSRIFAAADYLPEDAEGITAPRIDTATATALAAQGPGDLDAMLYPAPVAPAPVVKPDPSPGDAPMAFGLAFNRARSRGEKVFTWKGRQYTTQRREEVTPGARPIAHAPDHQPVRRPAQWRLHRPRAGAAYHAPGHRRGAASNARPPHRREWCLGRA